MDYGDPKYVYYERVRSAIGHHPPQSVFRVMLAQLDLVTNPVGFMKWAKKQSLVKLREEFVNTAASVVAHEAAGRACVRPESIYAKPKLRNIWNNQTLEWVAVPA